MSDPVLRWVAMSVNRSDDGIAPCPVIANLAAKHGLPVGSLEDQPTEKCTVVRTPKDKVAPTLDCTDDEKPAESVLECASTDCGSPSVASVAESGSPSIFGELVLGSPMVAAGTPSRCATPLLDVGATSPDSTNADALLRADHLAQSCAHAEHLFQARAEQALIARLRATRAQAARLKQERDGSLSTQTACPSTESAPEADVQVAERKGVDLPAWLSLVTIALLLLALSLEE